MNQIKSGVNNDGSFQYRDDYQTQRRGSNDAEYQIYRSCAGDKDGMDTLTGKPLKTYEEWINS